MEFSGWLRNSVRGGHSSGRARPDGGAPHWPSYGMARMPNAAFTVRISRLPT